MAKARFSKYGLNPESAIDLAALSNKAKYITVSRPVIISSAAGATATAVFTQNATVKHALGPVGIAGTVVAAYMSQGTLAAGGTLSAALYAYDASANAEIALTSGLNPEAATVRESQTFTLAGTNTELAADDTFELHCTASDDAVSQDAKSVWVTIVLLKSEADTEVDR